MVPAERFRTRGRQALRARMQRQWSDRMRNRRNHSPSQARLHVQAGSLTVHHGVSVFYKDPGGAIFHTYSSYARGIDLLNTAYNYLDLVPKGRDEIEHPGWVR